MYQALSNLSITLPLSSKRGSTTSSKTPYGIAFSHTHDRKSINMMETIAGESRDNLDRLQRPMKRPQQSQNKRRVAPAVPIDRFPTARTVQQMIKIMEDPSVYSGGWPSPLPVEGSGYNYSRGRTSWEIKEGENEYKMRFDMPGMTKEDVKVWVEEKMLVVKAEKLPKEKVNGDENGEEEGEWSAKSYGRYSSRIALPENIQFEKISAEVKDGVLYIIMPKASTNAKILDINVQ